MDRRERMGRARPARILLGDMEASLRVMLRREHVDTKWFKVAT